MNIYDLTRGHYSNIYNPIVIEPFEEELEKAYERCESFSEIFNKPFKDFSSTLKQIPIFLVESPWQVIMCQFPIRNV